MVVLLGVHGGAVSAAWAADCPGWLSLVLMALVAASGWREVHREMFYRPGRPSRLVWTAEGNWQVYVEDRWQAACLERGVFEHPFLVVLPVRTDDGCLFRVVIAPDGTDRDSYRRLRVRLRLGI